MGVKTYCFKKSLWIFHIGTGSCNNCDIEVLDCLTPRYDIERFGMLLAGSIRHADVLVVTGEVNKKSKKRLIELYHQAPKPCIVIACGTCACSGGIFKTGYNFAGPLDKVIPVDIYIPGCPPKPEAIIAGIVKFLKKNEKNN